MIDLKKRKEIKNIKKTYGKRIENVLIDVPEKDVDSERKRITGDLYYALQHTDYTGIEYFMYGLYNKSHREWYDYLPDNSANLICKRMNDIDSSINTANKYEVYLKFKKYYKREVIQISKKEDKETFLRFLDVHSQIMTKPCFGSLGDDCIITKKAEVENRDALFDMFFEKYQGCFVAEEIVVQTEEMRKYNPTSVNTLRITTVRMNDRVEAESFLRVGRMFSLVDNVAKGGIVCTLNQESGEIISAIDKKGTKYICHPHTRMKLIGSVVPKFGEAVELAKELALVMPNYRYIGWDLALTESGWVLIELNARAGIYCIQQTLGRGIRKDFEQFFRELGLPTDFPGEFDDVFMNEINGFKIKGTSMLPLLRENKDTVILNEVSSFNGRFKRGDVVLYKRGNQNVLHRIADIVEDNGLEYIMQGDNQREVEIIKPAQIVGIMTAVIRNGKRIAVDDVKYQRYTKKILEKMQAGRNFPFFRRVCQSFAVKRKQHSGRQYDKGQYLYGNSSASKIVGWLSECHKRHDEPYLKVVENGIILPLKTVKTKYRTAIRGGVVTQNGQFVEESGEFDFGGSYDFNKDEVKKCNLEVIYLGRAFPHFGVVFADTFRRLYFKYSEEGKPLKMCVCGTRSIPGTFGKTDNLCRDLFVEAGIDPDDIIDVREPIQFKKVYVPEPGYEYNRCYRDELYLPYKAAVDKVQIPSQAGKLFLTCKDDSKSKYIGAKTIANFFRVNGFEIVDLYGMPAKEKIKILQGADCVASIEGTTPLHIVFCKKGIKQIIVRRDIFIHHRQFLFNELMGTDVTYIDSYHNYLPGLPIHYDIGPFCIIISRHLRQYAKDNGLKLPAFWFISNNVTRVKYAWVGLKKLIKKA